MRKSTLNVYNGTVSTGGLTITTDPSFNGPLGEGNQIAAQILVNLVSGTTPAFTFRVQHSANGTDWINRNTNPEVNGVALTAGTLNSFLVQDAGATPLLSYVRFQLTVTGATAQAQVAVWVTTRDNA